MELCTVYLGQRSFFVSSLLCSELHSQDSTGNDYLSCVIIVHIWCENWTVRLQQLVTRPV